jgi:hypothetical protein
MRGFSSILESTSTPETDCSSTFPDRYHFRDSGEIDLTEDYGEADLFPSGIIRWVCRPLAECRIWPMKSPFLAGKKYFNAFSLNKSTYFV